MEEANIRKVIQTAYIEGIHNEQNPEKVESGFHPEFQIFLRRGTDIARAGYEAMLNGVIAQRERDPSSGAVPVEGHVVILEINGDAAIARVDLSKDGVIGCVDYLSLYRFEDGWKIVSKVYQPQAQ